MWGGHEYWGAGHMGFGMIGMLVFWGIAVLALVAIVKWIVGGATDRRTTASGTALDELGKHYARSEIGREEFNRKRQDLSGPYRGINTR